MGEVWKAQDLRFDRRFVAIKLLREDETHREDAANRERLQRLLREESDDGRLTSGLSVTLLDEVLQSGKGLDQLRARVQQWAGVSQGLDVEQVLQLFDELLSDPSCCENARVRARLRRLFRDEANSVADLRHDNIVSISDYGDHDGVPYLVMDYIEGVTLLRVIQRGERLARARQLRLIGDLCAGLAYAHKRNLVHRDIKPANLIIERGTDSLKILDFGVVKRLQDTPESTMGLPIGTLCYMSPEQIGGSASVDRRSDIFSVGSVFYELLAGQKAFPVGNGMADLIARIQNVPPPPVREAVPDLEPEIESILERALEKEADHRYQFMADMQRDLSRVRMQIEAAAEEQDRTLVTDRSEKTIVVRQTPEPLFPRLLRRGERALEQGDFAIALDSADQVLALDPTNQAAQDLRARAQAVERARKLSQGLELARRQLAAGDLSNVRRTSQLLRELDPGSQSVKQIIAELERAERAREEARQRVQRLHELVSTARGHLTAGDFAAAARAADEALTLDPSSAEAAGLAQEAEDRLAEQRERETRERQIRSLVASADEALRSARYDTAVGALQEARDLAPDDADLAARLAEAARIQERAREEERQQRRLRDALAAARDLQSGGDLDEALRSLEVALAIEPANPEVLAIRREIESALQEREATQIVDQADQLFRGGAHQEAFDLLTSEQTVHPRVARYLRSLQEEVAKQREAERAEAARKEAERLRVVAEREEAERRRVEAARKEAERLRVAAEREEAERQRAEAARKEAERLRVAAEREEAERQRAEAARKEAKRLRVAAEREEAERQRAEAARKEAERLRVVAEREEAERQRAEAARKEADRLRVAAEREEAERQRAEAARKEAERLRVLAERKEAERQRESDAHADVDRTEADRTEDDRTLVALSRREEASQATEVQPTPEERISADQQTAQEGNYRRAILPRYRTAAMVAGALLLLAVVGWGIFSVWRATGPTTETVKNAQPKTGEQVSQVTVVLHPWARVRIEGKDGATAPGQVFVTPFTVDLKPGKYALRCENSGLTPAQDIDIEVRPGQPVVINQPMPGFDPAAVLDRLLGPSR